MVVTFAIALAAPSVLGSGGGRHDAVARGAAESAYFVPADDAAGTTAPAPLPPTPPQPTVLVDASGATIAPPTSALPLAGWALAGPTEKSGATGSPVVGPSVAASSTGFQFNVSENYTRSAPWTPINEKSAYDARDEGIVLRLLVPGPVTGTHSVHMDVQSPGGFAYSSCDSTLATGGVTYSYYVFLCVANNEVAEATIADMKTRPGLWQTSVTYDGTPQGARNFTMSSPGLHVGMHDLLNNVVDPITGVTDPRFWDRLAHVTGWTLRNTGTSPAYTRNSANRSLWLHVETPNASSVTVANLRDFSEYVWGPLKGDAYARDIAPGVRDAINLSWIPGSNTPNAPPIVKWRGLLRLTPHYWLATPWAQVPRSVALDGTHTVHFYPDSVAPDDPAFASDPSWPIANALADNLTALWSIFHGRYGLAPPVNTNGNTIFSVRDGVNACGFAYWGSGEVMTDPGCGSDAKHALHIFAMEFHHNLFMSYVSTLEYLAKGGIPGVLEGCAEVGQETANKTFGLGVSLASVQDFIHNDLGRDPYAAALSGSTLYGSTYFMCRMWMDAKGENFQASLADVLNDLDVWSAGSAYAKATGERSDVGEVMWRWYVNDSYPGHVPSYPERFLANVDRSKGIWEPVIDAKGGGDVKAIPDLDPGRMWIARYTDFDPRLQYSIEVASPTEHLSGFGVVPARDRFILSVWNANAPGGPKGDYRVIAEGTPFTLPHAWTDSPNDKVGIILLAESDAFMPFSVVTQHPLTVTFAASGACVPGRPC